MDINTDLLYLAGAEEKEYAEGDLIFNEGHSAHFYYQVSEGMVKLCNHNQEGKEFIQNIVTSGQCFGEALFFNNREYPINAVAVKNCKIIKLSKLKFDIMMNLSPILYEVFCAFLAERNYFQSVMLRANSLLNPEGRIIGLMVYLKRLEEDQEKFSYKVPFTRQQVASLTGICVETAIRTIKNMERNKIVKITDRKIFF